MNASRVLLVGYQDQDNLGLRYLASHLASLGHAVRLTSFGPDPQGVIEAVQAWQPHVVGFSLIFQFMAEDFARVISQVRAAGSTAHFTMGGHYPSFEPEVVLGLVPELDSVVRFEGELTLAELVRRLRDGEDWRTIQGIAWREGEHVHRTPARESSVDLDALAWPERGDIDYRAQRIPTASILASRGCPWTCSFCSIITFYEANGTRGRRRRDPVRVVDEIEHLVRARGVELLLFQDDDFLAGGRAATAWAHTIAAEMVTRGLHEACRFRISCRSDEVRADTLEPLVRAGLRHVYMGVEAGDEGALRHLNKHITAEVHLRAGRVLRDVGLSFDFGFMLLEPWSDLESTRTNLSFLREFSAGGYTPAGFCRTLPYVGTPVERRMREEGRLTGVSLEADYRFLDPRLDVLWDWALVAFAGRNHGDASTWDVLRRLLFELRLDLPGRPSDAGLLEAAQVLCEASNEVLVDLTEQALDVIVAKDLRDADDTDLVELARLAKAQDRAIRRDIKMLWRLRPSQQRWLRTA